LGAGGSEVVLRALRARRQNHRGVFVCVRVFVSVCVCYYAIFYVPRRGSCVFTCSRARFHGFAKEGFLIIARAAGDVQGQRL